MLLTPRASEDRRPSSGLQPAAGSPIGRSTGQDVAPEQRIIILPSDKQFLPVYDM